VEDSPDYNTFENQLDDFEAELAATTESVKPLFSVGRLDRLTMLVHEIISMTTAACTSADEVRFVAAVFKGAVDLWYPRK